MKLKFKRVDLPNLIIYSILSLLFAIFFILPAVDVLRETIIKSNYIILLKAAIGITGIIVILYKYITGYTNYLTNLDINEKNVTTLKWTLRKNNLSAFFKTVLSLTPFLLFSIMQGSHLNNVITGTNFIQTDIARLPVIDDLEFEFSRSWIFIFFEKVLNNNKEISFAISVFLFGAILSSALLLFIYVIYKISMNKYFKEIKKQFNNISRNIKDNKISYEQKNFEEIVYENEKKELSYQSDRYDKLYAILDQKEADFWKEVKKSTTPPNFNLVK
ncbi:hypothetical protein [Spiroplasma endosymbiont of Diplazon laetatorius]|uniref:hypothetical protein n=1 Tax=Spiroplasma endosymbiont of Diplazon laetatorius TaxID=3066322 RepID=UPI0030D4EA7D